MSETRKTKVTIPMKRKRAEEIADSLNKIETWGSHGRGISMDVLRKKLKLKIDDFGQKEDLSGAITNYNKLLRDYSRRTRRPVIIHSKLSFHPA